MSGIARPVLALRADMNGDGSVTLSDAPAWAAELYFLPGDWLIWTASTYAAPAAGFLDLGPGDYGGVVSGAASALVWLAMLLAAIWVWSAARDFDRRLTASLAAARQEARRRIRVGAALLRYRLRRGTRRAVRAATAVEPAVETEISQADLRVLRLHAELAPGYALAVSDVAAALGVGRPEARERLERLVQLKFLSTTLGGCEGESAHVATRAGRAFLEFSVRRAARPDG